VTHFDIAARLAHDLVTRRLTLPNRAA
jgi:hypothetical protein